MDDIISFSLVFRHLLYFFRIPSADLFSAASHQVLSHGVPEEINSTFDNIMLVLSVVEKEQNKQKLS